MWSDLLEILFVNGPHISLLAHKILGKSDKPFPSYCPRSSALEVSKNTLRARAASPRELSRGISANLESTLEVFLPTSRALSRPPNYASIALSRPSNCTSGWPFRDCAPLSDPWSLCLMVVEKRATKNPSWPTLP